QDALVRREADRHCECAAERRAVHCVADRLARHAHPPMSLSNAITKARLVPVLLTSGVTNLEGQVTPDDHEHESDEPAHGSIQPTTDGLAFAVPSRLLNVFSSGLPLLPIRLVQPPFLVNLA